MVGGIPTPLKNMSSSVGMMTFPIYGKTKLMFQTTKQDKERLGHESIPFLFFWYGFGEKDMDL